MRKQPLRLGTLLAVLAVAGLQACSAPTDGAAPTPATSPAGSSGSPTAGASLTPAPDTETTVPAPSPSPPPPPTAGPGAGNAELAIMVRPSETEAAVNYTLVCRGGVPSTESRHPAAAAACAALKDNAALLSPPPRNTDQVCTEQYGGPQQATVTGIVDDTPVEITFSRTNGCEISAWNAVKSILGPAGAAV